jgi:hypothetical protein
MKRTFAAAIFALLAVTTPARAAYVDTLDATLDLNFAGGELTGGLDLSWEPLGGINGGRLLNDVNNYEITGSNLSLNGAPLPLTPGLCCKLPAVARDAPARGLARAHAASSRSPTSWTASVSADGPRPKARSTRRASPRMSRVRLKIAA